MKINITKENYEAYYLDFLEGNLNDIEKDEFSKFIILHSELRIEEEGLLELDSSTNEKLDSTFTNSIKIFDKNETISHTTIELFEIAALENILNSQKKEEFDKFINQNQSSKSEFELYKKTKLFPDLSITFSNKKSLKRGVIIPLYVKFSAVAAVLIASFMLIPFNNSETYNFLTAQHIQSRFNAKKITPLIEIKNMQQNKSIVAKNEIKLKNIQVNQQNNNQNQQLEIGMTKEINSISFKKPSLFETKPNNYEIKNIDFSSVKTQNNSYFSEDNSYYLPIEEMKNPVPIITNGLKNKIKREIDFRSAKATDKKQGGFYFKLGKLEISRKIAPKDVLALK